MSKSEVRVTLVENELREALIEAYEAGWRGCLEMKEEYADMALKKLNLTPVQDPAISESVSSGQSIVISVDVPRSREIEFERNSEGVWEQSYVVLSRPEVTGNLDNAVWEINPNWIQTTRD